MNINVISKLEALAKLFINYAEFLRSLVRPNSLRFFIIAANSSAEISTFLNKASIVAIGIFYKQIKLSRLIYL